MTYLFNNNQQVYSTGTQLVQYVDDINTQLDALGRLRVAPPTQSWWYAPIVDKDGDLRYIENFTGTNSTSSFVQNIASILITSGTDSTGSAIRISRRRHKLRPSVSMVWQSAGAFNGYDANVVKRRGLFTAFNGTFFEVSNNELYFVVRRRLIDGTLVEDRYPRSSWTYDRLDGTGPSNINLTTGSAVAFTLGSFVSSSTIVISTITNETKYNVKYNTASTCPFRIGTKATVTGFNDGNTGYNGITMISATSTNTVTLTYAVNPGSYTAGHGTGIATQTGLHMKYVWWLDFAGSRTNRIRFGINVGHGNQVCHMIDYTGQLGTHWANAPSVPDRFEMTNTGVVSYLPTMTWSETCINTEAEVELNPSFGLARTTSTTVYSAGGTNEYAILGVGLRAGEPYQRADLQVQAIDITDAANQGKNANPATFLWRLLLNPTILTNDVVPTNIGKTTRQWDYTPSTTWTGGIELIGGLFNSGASFDVRTSLNFLNLGSNIAYTDADKIVLIVKQISGGGVDAEIWATMNYIEAL
jgi:hypothetical protein